MATPATPARLFNLMTPGLLDHVGWNVQVRVAEIARRRARVARVHHAHAYSHEIRVSASVVFRTMHKLGSGASLSAIEFDQCYKFTEQILQWHAFVNLNHCGFGRRLWTRHWDVHVRDVIAAVST